jgi:hypothetical protein
VIDRREGWITSKKDKSYYLRGGHDNGILNDIYFPGDGILYFGIGLFLGGTIFGAVHCCGWTFSFPTLLEQLLWRIASIVTTSCPTIMFIFSAPLVCLFMPGIGLRLAAIVIVAPYVVARLFIMVEVFRSLFYLPPEAYISTWADNIPRFS